MLLDRKFDHKEFKIIPPKFKFQQLNAVCIWKYNFNIASVDNIHRFFATIMKCLVLFINIGDLEKWYNAEVYVKNRL